MESDLLLTEDRGPIRLWTINRPKQLNALNVATLQALEQQVSLAQRDRDLRVIILHGAGEKAFAAGADVLELESMNPIEAAEFSRYGQSVFERLGELSIPVIAAVQGFALGGGLELALACDFIYASENAVLGLVESDLGLIPGYSGISRLVERIGESRSREALYTAQKFSAQESLSIGLVNRVFEESELMDESIRVANAIAQKSRGCVQRLKGLVHAIQEGTPASKKALQEYAFGLTFADSDAAEGIQSFKEKRPPKFG